MKRKLFSDKEYLIEDLITLLTIIAVVFVASAVFGIIVACFAGVIIGLFVGYPLGFYIMFASQLIFIIGVLYWYMHPKKVRRILNEGKERINGGLHKLQEAINVHINNKM